MKKTTVTQTVLFAQVSFNCVCTYIVPMIARPERIQLTVALDVAMISSQQIECCTNDVRSGNGVTTDTVSFQCVHSFF